MNEAKPHRPPPASGTKSHWWRRGGHRSSDTDAVQASSPAAEQERLILEALADLRDLDVREVMTPRVDVAYLSIPVHEEDVAQAVRETGHSAFPVVHDDLDDLVGILFVTDLFRSRRPGPAEHHPSSRTIGPGRTAASSGGPEPAPTAPQGLTEPTTGPTPLEISRRLRQPHLIPETLGVLEALADLRRHRRGFAVVVDEYGGVSGILTVKDLLEPLVGKLHDEFDLPDDEPAIVRVDATRWLVDGRANVDDARERLGIDIPDGEYVTLAGFLLDGLGHVPEEGEKLTVDGWTLRVVEMDKRRIVKVVAHHRAPDPAPEVPTGTEDRRGEMPGANGSVAQSAPVPRGSPHGLD